MQTIINLFMKLSGAGRVWDFLDGKKTYAAAALAILGGLFGLGTELAPILAAHNTGALFAFLQHLGSDPNFQTLAGGLGLLGLGHKAVKAADPTADGAPSAASAAPRPGSAT